MRLQKSFQLALNILLHSRLRSWLTIIGIVIGVAAVVAIVSIGEGAQLNLQQRLSGLGADIITISPGGGRATGGFGGGGVEYRVRGSGGGGGGFGESSFTSTAKNLTIKDLQVIRAVEGVSVASGTISGRVSMYYLAESSSVSVQGVDPITWNAISTATLESGRFLNQGDANAVVVGSNIAKSTFKQPLAVNRDVTINGKPFKIVGILQPSGVGGDDSRILMPLNVARDTIEGAGKNEFSSINVKAASAGLVDQITTGIDAKLMISRHLTTRTKDFRVSSAQSTQAAISATLQTFTAFLGAIAAVSLLVGAVGIANTMFTSVLEKTKEIGIMKAIGAKNKDIMIIFLLNSGLVGLVGGLLGVILGTAISSVLPDLGIRLMGGGGSLTTSVSPGLIISALVLSVSIGMVAGAIPAYRASKLKPVDALRYE